MITTWSVLQQSIANLKQRFANPPRYFVKEDFVYLTTFLQDTQEYLYSIILSVDITSQNLNNIISVGSNIDAITNVGENIDLLESIENVLSEINIINNNITALVNISSNLSELLLTNDNAIIATTQAGIATTQAGIATTKAGEASTSATIASTQAGIATAQAVIAINGANVITNNLTAINTIQTNITEILAVDDNATIATTKANAAATSESNASTYAGQANTAKVAAQLAQTNTENKYIDFDKKYLGAKTADPTLDNEGATLSVGALYFNSVSNIMKQYTGSTWVVAYASASGALLAANNLSDLSNTTTARSNIGLSNVDNTSDINKPISTLQQTALNLKVDKVTGKELSTNDYTTIEKNKLSNIEVEANKYIHPSAHEASIINQDSTHRFVTDSEKTTWNSKADLTAGKVPSSQLPSYVDDVLEYANVAAFPITGESGIIYIDLSLNKTYRWTGSIYAEIGSGGVSLGETSSTAYRGDRGKIAYDHSQSVTGNPHGIVKTDIGLGNVDNTSDVNKPVSTAQATALDLKVDKITGKGLSTEDYTTAEKNKLTGINAGAQVNNISDVNATDLTDSGDSSLHYHSSDRSRSNHTGTQSADTIVDGTTNKVFTGTEKTLLGTATATAGNSKIPISSETGKLDTWISNASETVAGKVEFATPTETVTGTSTALAVHPAGVAAAIAAAGGGSGVTILQGSKTWVPEQIVESTTVTVTGAAVGDACFANFSLVTIAKFLSCEITSTNTATVFLYLLEDPGVIINNTLLVTVIKP